MTKGLRAALDKIILQMIIIKGVRTILDKILTILHYLLLTP